MPGHDHAKITAPENQNFAAQVLVPQIQSLLRLPGCEDPCRPCTCDRERTDTFFPAAGSQDQTPEAQPFQIRVPGEHRDSLFRNRQDVSVWQKSHAGNFKPPGKTCRILRTGQFSSEGNKTKALMQTLRASTASSGR